MPPPGGDSSKESGNGVSDVRWHETFDEVRLMSEVFNFMMLVNGISYSWR